MILETKKSFGKISQFDQFEMEIVQRNNFVPVPKRLQIEVPKSISILKTEEKVKLSNYYYSNQFIKSPLQKKDNFSSKSLNYERLHVVGPPDVSETIIDQNVVEWVSAESLGLSNHAFSNDEVYKNLQRLCLEVLDPLFELTGERVEIKEGVIFLTDVNTVDGDSFFLDQVKGNAVVFCMKGDDDGNTKFKKCRDLISEFSLFDRMFVDFTTILYGKPSIAVSVNRKKRKSTFKRSE